MKQCPSCRLPRPPAAILTGEEHGQHIVFGVCSACAGRYQRLSHSTAHKLLNGACARAAADPERYWSALFPERGAAQVLAGMLTHPQDSEGALRAFGWRSE